MSEKRKEANTEQKYMEICIFFVPQLVADLIMASVIYGCLT